MKEKLGKIYSFAGFNLYEDSKYLSWNSEPVDINHQAFDVLLYLAQHPKSFVKAGEIYEAVLSKVVGGKRKLHFLIKRINEILGAYSNGSELLQTNLKKEYALMSEVQIFSVEINAENKQRESSNLFTFNFPEAVKIPCEQYLLYFATFLKDLGINAASNLQEEAGKVLFSVTPTEDIE